MQEELRRYSTKVVADGGMPIEARVGINTGEVVVRSITTGAGQVEYTPIGDTINLAFLGLIMVTVPELYRCFVRISSTLLRSSEERSIERLYASLDDMDFSRDVLARRPINLAVLPVRECEVERSRRTRAGDRRLEPPENPTSDGTQVVYCGATRRAWECSTVHRQRRLAPQGKIARRKFGYCLNWENRGVVTILRSRESKYGSELRVSAMRNTKRNGNIPGHSRT